ncbi:HNH/ENDO VII family nuclease [Frankia gtarii]|uniref:HNH/ENDO VII family nuclease n=1 Tax=Frankia gtarii TaxID=2950102 RepID=UPI0021BE1FA2|nr:HNH/ENDO VII family nuclease [Frankia gtarii]
MALESCTPNSFDGDTAVLMADGTRKRIRDVRVGDRVLATDPVTGRTEARTVTALIVGQGLKHLVAVSVDTGRGSATLTATDHHPFWDDVDHAWVDADDLTSADTLRTPTGSHIRVTATREYDRAQTVYNLTVDTLHTYYVLAGQAPVLVHNASCSYWSPIDYNGQRIYQRDDLVNPSFASPTDKYGRSNLQRMRQGLAPIGPDGNPVNLHHLLQTQDGPIAEVTQKMHFGNYRQLHWKAGARIPSSIDRNAFSVWKSQYWKDRAAGFGN